MYEEGKSLLDLLNSIKAYYVYLLHSKFYQYTTIAKQAREHLQFDQGEDRWLCTLLLQRGWRVEYSAASDSYTGTCKMFLVIHISSLTFSACPEGFDEFYNQRRRWMPSTILNIWDILQNWKSVTETNEDISWLYILYQVIFIQICIPLYFIVTL